MESLGHSITEEQSTKVFKHNNYVLMDTTRLTVVLETLDPRKPFR